MTLPTPPQKTPYPLLTPPSHTPVLYQAVLEVLHPQPGGCYIDATLGGGGHAEGILQHSAPDGQLLGLDADPRGLLNAQQRLAAFDERIHLVHGNFRDLATIAAHHGFNAVDGILLDLGVSSSQIDDAAQGFSFLKNGLLDMRFDPAVGATAAELVNTLSEANLADIIYNLGEDRKSRRIARAIVHARPLHTTQDLAEVISRAVGGRRGDRIHPATRTFQALRMYINDELGALTVVLPQALTLLRPEGVLAVISFHSLEDRLVKHFLRRESQDCICPPRTPTCQCGHRAQLVNLYRKGITPDSEEIARNPRSRSARLRAARKL